MGRVYGNIKKRADFSLSGLSLSLLMAATFLAPLLFGSTKRVVVDALCAVVGVSLILAPKKVASYRLAFLLSGAACFIAAYLLLCIRNSRPWWHDDPIMMNYSNMLGPMGRPNDQDLISSTFFSQMRASGNAALFLGCFICAALHGANSRKGGRGSRAIRYGAMAYVILSVLLYAFAPNHVLWEERISSTNVLTGTFINRNSAATFFGFCTIIFAVSTAYRARPWLSKLEQRGYRLGKPMLRAAKTLMPDAIGLVVGMSALLITGSRAGTAATILAGGLITLVLRRSIFKGLKVSQRFVLTLLVLFAVLASLAGGRLVSRFQQEGLESSRLTSYEAMLPILETYALHGTGAGTFGDVFPRYRPVTIPTMGIWDIAHSTPLEIAIEMGVPFSLAVVGAYVFVGVALFRSSLASSANATIAFGVWTIAGLHSLIDFSLQIPGISAVTATIGGLAIGRSLRKRDAMRRTDADPQTSSIGP